MDRVRSCIAVAGTLALCGCAVAPPTGPAVVAMPGKDKTFDAFQADDVACRQYASQQIGYGSPQQAANDSAIGSTALGTVLGTAAGAAIGAASGLVVGGAAGLGAAQDSSVSLQQRYDIGYLQCMSAKGENVQMPVYSYSPAYYTSYPYYPAYGFVGFGFGFHHHSHRGHHFHH